MKISVVQMDVKFGDKKYNLDKIRSYCEKAKTEASDIVVFPECSLSGYCVESRDEALEYAESIEGYAVKEVEELCKKLGIKVVFGLIEKDDVGGVYNSCVLVGPKGVIGHHRKMHLPHLALDHYVDPGNLPIKINPTDGINIGMGICYDLAFPEYSRALALRKADIIFLPTNWPAGAEEYSPKIVSVRALENKLFYAAANRVGKERGYTFIGNSLICDTRGRELARAGVGEECILSAEIEPDEARNKRIERGPNFWMDYFGDRRPELYSDLTTEYKE